MKFNKVFTKSFLRHIYVGVGFVGAALMTYLSKGNHFGFNTETLVGVIAQTAIALSAVLQRYLDKTDPALGPVAEVVLGQVDHNLDPFTQPKPAVAPVVAPVAVPVVEPVVPVP